MRESAGVFSEEPEFAVLSEKTLLPGVMKIGFFEHF